MTRTEQPAPRHAALRPPPSPRRIEATGLATGLLIGLAAVGVWLAFRGTAPDAQNTSGGPGAHGTASGGSRSPVAVRIPAQSAVGPGTLDQEWTAYSDRSNCADWAGADGVSAYRLNSTQLAWFFADTYLGPAGPDIGFSRNSGFVHNSVVVQTTSGTTSTFVTMTGGGACPGPGRVGGPPAYSVVGPQIAPGASDDRYWDEDGLDLGGVIVKFYNRYLPGSAPFIPQGTVIASFPVSQLSSAGLGPAYGAVAHPAITPLPSYTPPGSTTPVMWGAALLRSGNTVYIYGTLTPDPAGPEKLLYLAKVDTSRITQFAAWQFYAGNGQWTGAQQDAQPVQQAANGFNGSSGFSVIAAGQRYWLIQADSIPGNQDIDAYPAASPWGPFDPAARIVLYRDPGIGLDAAHDYRIMYEARAEPALSTDSTLVISYNINSVAVTTGCVPISAYTNTLTQPRFISVPMAVFDPGADLSRYAVTTGPSDYPHVVSSDPAHWFNAWNYPSGCPPVPAATGLRASSGPGTATLNWAYAGPGMRYQVYLLAPGASGFALRATTQSGTLTLSGLSAGTYTVRVVPVSFKHVPGQSAQLTFAVP